MTQTLEQAQAKASAQAQSQAYQDMGLEYNARALCPPDEDKELQAILAREKEFRRDNRTPAPIRKEKEHLDTIDREIDKLVYNTVLTKESIYQIGLMTVLWHHHLERMELGDKNPIAKELLDSYHNLKFK